MTTYLKHLVLLLFRQGLDRFVEPPPGMGPASGDSQVFPLTFNGVVGLVELLTRKNLHILINNYAANL